MKYTFRTSNFGSARGGAGVCGKGFASMELAYSLHGRIHGVLWRTPRRRILIYYGYNMKHYIVDFIAFIFIAFMFFMVTKFFYCESS